MATQSNSITNRIIIRADSQNSDSPKNAQTSREISLKSHDDIEFAITLAKSGESISASAVARVSVEIFDIGARNAPSPRSVKLLLSKSTEDISDISDTCSFNAIIEVAAEENAFEAGSKWIRICAFSPEGKRTTFTQGWINIEESFGDSPAAETEIVQSFLKTEDAKGIFLQKDKNLSDLLDKAVALENLGALSAAETLQSIESACSQKADATHEHSEYLKKSEAQDLYASAESTEQSLNEIESEINIIEGNINAAENTITAIENKVLDSHLSKLPYGTLYFDKGKLFGSNFAIPNFPFSICATVRVDAWEGSTEGIQTIFQFGDNGTGALWGSICFNNVINNPNIQLRISKNTDGTVSYSEVSYFFDKDTFLGKEHTIVGICRELESTPVNFDIYVDGAKVATTPYKGLTLDSLSGTVNYAVNTSNQNDSSQPASANPMRLRNLYVFNFDISEEGSPYTIADYAAGRLIPPSLIGNQFTGMYGGGWSVSGDTATCSGTSTESYPRVTGGVIPSGFNFTFTIDIELSFSGTPSFEVYTDCQKAHAEIYDYSTQLTTQKDSANGGGFYGNFSLGITSSGHYRIKFDCESSLGNKGRMQLVIGALTSGTITLSDTYYTRCNLALENYTIARNATTTLVKDASGNSNDATVQGSGTVAGDNDQSIKVFVDEIKTQINQSNG